MLVGTPNGAATNSRESTDRSPAVARGWPPLDGCRRRLARHPLERGLRGCTCRPRRPRAVETRRRRHPLPDRLADQADGRDGGGDARRRGSTPSRRPHGRPRSRAAAQRLGPGGDDPRSARKQRRRADDGRGRVRVRRRGRRLPGSPRCRGCDATARVRAPPLLELQQHRLVPARTGPGDRLWHDLGGGDAPRAVRAARDETHGFHRRDPGDGHGALLQRRGRRTDGRPAMDSPSPRPGRGHGLLDRRRSPAVCSTASRGRQAGGATNGRAPARAPRLHGRLVPRLGLLGLARRSGMGLVRHRRRPPRHPAAHTTAGHRRSDHQFGQRTRAIPRRVPTDPR
jgi:hypothetical protein